MPKVKPLVNTPKYRVGDIIRMDPQSDIFKHYVHKEIKSYFAEVKTIEQEGRYFKYLLTYRTKMGSKVLDLEEPELVNLTYTPLAHPYTSIFK